MARDYQKTSYLQNNERKSGLIDLKSPLKGGQSRREGQLLFSGIKTCLRLVFLP